MKTATNKDDAMAKINRERKKRRPTGRPMQIFFLALLMFVVMILPGPGLSAQQANQEDIEALKKTAPKIFIDCESCDIDYIRTEVTFINYVRDRKEAQVHVLITTQNTGSGGSEYTLSFLGQNEFKGDDDTVRFFTNKTDTPDEIRQGLVKALKIGLMRYVAKTPIARRVNIAYRPVETAGAGADKWNSWVFSIGGSGFLSKQKRYSYQMVNGSVSANRVTPESKLRLGLSWNDQRNIFKFGSDEVKSNYSTQSFSGLYVKSLNDHWSVGFYLNAESSTYDNVKISLSPAPAVEFNLFPYSQSTRRQLRFLYRLSFQAVRYREETIYDKITESLLSESLSVTLELKEKWGTVSTTLLGRHYFHDFNKYSLDLNGELSLNLLKGLSFNIYGGGSRIHDQLSLPKGGASLEEVLLRRRQLETNYNYYFSVGFSYTFGSIYTNVVNPRFGSSGMSMSIGF